MTRPIIEAKGVSKRYRLGELDFRSLRKPAQELWALKDVSFAVQPAEAVAIIGRNGAGKSTLLKIISRITAPTAGEIRLRGRVASLLEVGTGFHPELTGRENVFLNGAVLGMTTAEVKRKFDEIAAFAELDAFLDTPVKRYSSGMYVRLAFAVAAHLEPEILIIDEVLAVGDIEFQKKCTGKMSQVAGQGCTVLFVSHNMVAVRSLCSRAILLTNGAVTMDGAANDVSEHYLQGGLNALGHAEWHDLANAPGNEFVRLKSLSVSCDGMERGRVDIQKDFEVAIEYYVLANCRGINVGLHLCNARGEPVISSGNLKSCSSSYDPWVERVYPPGLYRTSCFFPGCLLNDGRYSLSFDVNDYSAYRSHVHVVDALKFEVVDTGYMREEYHGPWPGSFRMKLPWSTKLLTTSVSR